jgi:hypothetical protein
MLRLRQLAVAIAVALSASTVGLSGQQPPSQQEVSVTAEPGWTFIPGVIAGAMYDSNVIVTTAITDTGNPPSDTYFTIDPTGSLKYRGKLTSFNANYRGTIRRYTTINALDSFDQHAGASFERRASKRLSMFANNQFTTAQTTDEIDLTGVPFRRAGSQSDTLAAGMSYRLSEHTDWDTRYDFTWAHFDRNAPDLTGGIINAIQTGIARRLTSRLKVGVEGVYRFASMDLSGNETVQFFDAGGTVSYELGQFTTVTGSGGMSHVDDQVRGVSKFGPYFSGMISHIAARAVFGASYQQAFVPSFGFGGSTHSQQASSWIDLPPIGHRLYVQGKATWRRTNPSDNKSALRLDTLAFRSTAGYALARQIRLQGVYVFTRQDSIVTGGEVNRNRVGVELVLFNPMRIQ